MAKIKIYTHPKLLAQKSGAVIDAKELARQIEQLYTQNLLSTQPSYVPDYTGAFDKFLADTKNTFFIAWDADQSKVAGFALMVYPESAKFDATIGLGKSTNIKLVAVDSAYRGQGLATRFIDKIEKHVQKKLPDCKRVSIDTWAAPLNMGTFYIATKAGYDPMLWEDFFQKGADLVHFTKPKKHIKNPSSSDAVKTFNRIAKIQDKILKQGADLDILPHVDVP